MIEKVEEVKEEPKETEETGVVEESTIEEPVEGFMNPPEEPKEKENSKPKTNKRGRPRNAK